MASGSSVGSATGQYAEKYLGWQIISQAVVVILGLMAVVVSLGLILDAYDVSEDTTSTPVTATTTGLTGTSNQSGGQNGGAPSPSSSGALDGASNGGGPTGPGGGSTTVAAAPVAAATPAPQTTSVSSSSVVSILTPIMAGIVGIAGLFFGVSATGSARGRQAGADQTAADTTAKAADTTAKAADTSAKAIDLVAEAQQVDVTPTAPAGGGEEKGPKPPRGRTEPPRGDEGF